MKRRRGKEKLMKVGSGEKKGDEKYSLLVFIPVFGNFTGLEVHVGLK